MAAFIWPLKDHIITRRFDYMSPVYYQGQHGATDLIRYGATQGAPVLAIADGTLWANPLDYLSGLNCYIDHADGWRSGYRHLSRHVFPYNQPFSVKQGQTIGFAGSTGLSTGPHLHMDLWNKKRQSPEAFVKLGWYAHDPELYLGIEEEDMRQVVWVIKSADAADQGQYVFDGVLFSRLTGKMKKFLVDHPDTYDVREDTWAGGEITEALSV